VALFCGQKINIIQITVKISGQPSILFSKLLIKQCFLPKSPGGTVLWSENQYYSNHSENIWLAKLLILKITYQAMFPKKTPGGTVL